jgi:hypothetical protein
LSQPCSATRAVGHLEHLLGCIDPHDRAGRADPVLQQRQAQSGAQPTSSTVSPRRTGSVVTSSDHRSARALRPLGTLRPLEELLEVFMSAGFDQHGALHAARLFTGFLYGHIQDELQEQVNDPDETDDVLRLGLHRLPITRFPRLRSLAGVLGTYDGAAELDEGLAILIAGLRSQLLN